MFGLVGLNQISLENFCVGFINTASPEVSGSVNLGKDLMDGHTRLRNTVLGSHKIPINKNSSHRNDDQYSRRRSSEINSMIVNRKRVSFT